MKVRKSSSDAMKIKRLLIKYKKGIKKDYLSDVDKGLVKTYLEEFVKDLLLIIK